MARDEFIQNVRAAVRFVAPTVDVDNPYTNPKTLEKSLRAAAVWLTPKSVAGFRAEDFKDLSPQRQAKLRDAVEGFLAVAGELPPDAPATAAQVRTALRPFMEVVTTVQDILRGEWRDAVAALLQDAEAWSVARGWATKRDERQLAEDFLGTYTVPRLLIARDASRLVVEPVARFVPAAQGLVDLAVLPSYDSARITRSNGQWFVQPAREGKRRKWSEGAFVDTVNELSQLA